MNFFPNLFQTKPIKKTTSFVNPLTGTFYNNKQFLNNSNQTPRSISQSINIKNTKVLINNGEEYSTQKKLKSKKRNLTKEQRKRIERQIVAINATARLAEPMAKTQNIFELNKKCLKSFDDVHASSHQINLSKTFAFSTSQNFINKKNFLNSQQLRYQLAQSTRKSNDTESFSESKPIFDNIQILILDILNSFQDFKSKIVTINLQKYFRSFFKKQLSGLYTEDFLKTVERYYTRLWQSDRLNQKLDPFLFNQQLQLFRIKSRMVFLSKIQELQNKKTQQNLDKIMEMIKYYCIPEKQFRQSCLRDIILMLSTEAYEKYNCSRHEEYILLDQNGNQITQIIQIKFSARKLFLTSRTNSIANYSRYLKMIDEYVNEGKKLTFNEGIRRSFRKKIAKGNFDEDHFNYTQNFELESLKRKVEVYQAEKILKKRTEIHRLNKFTPRQNFVYYERPSSGNKSNKPLSQQELPKSAQIETKEFIRSKSPSPIQKDSKSPSKHWKVEISKISSPLQTPETSILRSSISPTRTSKLKSASSSKGFKDEKLKLKNFLYSSETTQLNSQIQKGFLLQFKDLAAQNDSFESNFNVLYSDRVLLKCLIANFEYFKGKSEEQINRIITAIKRIKANSTQNTKVSQTQLPSSSPLLLPIESETEDSPNMRESISWQQYKNLRTIIECLQPKEVLMEFIAVYLKFNEYGELSKQTLFQEIKFVLGQKQQGAVEVIGEVIWCWLCSNSIIENGAVNRLVLESWFEKYRIVYCMLISLIFGTNHTSVLDIGYEVLVEK